VLFGQAELRVGHVVAFLLGERGHADPPVRRPQV
jgi:hypothetical protein